MTVPDHRPRRRFRMTRVIMALAIVGATVMIDPSAGSATVGTPVDAGDAVVVTAENHAKTLDRGGSATEFSLRLPNGSTCPGDTLNDDWRIQSFVIPSGVDPGTLTYGVIGPVGTTEYALYDLDTHPLADGFIPPKSAPDAPAVVGAPPPFSFAIFPPGSLPDGRYRIGLACTYFRKTAKYWDTEIIVTNTASDHPAHFTWRLAGASVDPTDPGHDSSRLWLVLVAAGVVGAAGVGAFLARRASGRVTLLKEPT